MQRRREAKTLMSEAVTTEKMASPGALRAPRGTQLSCKGWQQEAALRMLLNNLDPEVAEKPDELIVYGGPGRAARSRESFPAVGRALRGLAAAETLAGRAGQ